MADLERQGISKAQTPDQYGAIESDPTKFPNEVSEKLPLLLGRWEVSPNQLYRVGLACWVTWFAIHRLCDICYIFTVDARFPEGLEHLYSSEAQRLESVSYMQQVLLCGFIHRVIVFIVVLTFLVFHLFARFDAALHAFFAAIGTWWESENCMRRGCNCCCCVPCGFVCAPIGQLAWFLFSRPLTWCGDMKNRMFNGQLATDISNRFGFPRTIKELLIGSVYLTLMSALFFILSVPFIYWMQTIDLKFGFANSLTVSAPNFRQTLVLGTISILLFTVPKKLMFLAVLQYRLGWAFMWAGLMISVVYAQFNVAMIAPMLGLNNKFPTTNFAVGRGFPLVETPNQKAPWISLNRLYFPDKFSQSLDKDAEPRTYYTNDKSKGSLALVHQPAGQWTLSGTAWFDPAATVYAKTDGAASKLGESTWSLGGPQTRMGVRSGDHLRDKLFGFAGERKIGIGDIYMVDGSHKDARANAFVTGAGNHSIIGLYDTLFLGKRGKDAPEDTEEDAAQEVAQSDSLVQHLTEVIQGVNVEEEDNDRRAPRNSAPTAAMNDDEIVAILAHELAHSAMKHMEMGMATQVFTSFMTFATLGWMAHSPLAAAALTLHLPVLHVGVCVYDNVVGPPLEGFMKLFTDGLTRHNEYVADEYATKISEKYGTGLQTALAKLTVNSNQDPDPPWFHEALHSDHPTLARRWAHIENVKKETYGDHKKP